MLHLNNIEIPLRIALAPLVPMLAFVASAFKDIMENHAIYSTADQIGKSHEPSENLDASVLL